MDECWLMIADCRTSLGIHLFWFLSLLEEMSTIWSFRGFLFIWSELLTSSRSAVHTRLFSLFAYNPFHFHTNSLFCFLLSGSFTSALIFVLFPLLLWDFKNYYYFLLKNIYFLHICVFCLGAYMYIACVHGPWDQNSVGSRRTAIAGGCGTPCGCWALDSGPL